MDDNQRYVVRNEDTVETAPRPTQTTTTQSQTNAANASTTQMPVAANQSTVQSTTSRTAPPADQMVAHNVSERVVDPAADRAAAVDWVNRLVWLVVGVMAVLLVIRFALLAAGANESADARAGHDANGDPFFFKDT